MKPRTGPRQTTRLRAGLLVLRPSSRKPIVRAETGESHAWWLCQEIGILLAALGIPALASGDTLHPQELSSVRFGRSQQTLSAIRLPPVSLGAPPPVEAEPLHLNPNRKVSLAPPALDALLASAQLAPGHLSPLTIRRHASIEGGGAGLAKAGFVMTLSPADPVGAVGDTQFVQWVNSAITVFDKRTGKLVAGPLPGNLLWTGFGGNCQEHNNGDPIVQYDRAAKRWLLAQFSVTDGTLTGYSQCLAVSTSADAAGSYWLYEFQYPALDDYPKVGVWHDGYYASFNMYEVYTDPDGKEQLYFLGARACAYERTNMLRGAPARQLCFQLSSKYFGLLPSDSDSPHLPANLPSYFVALGADPGTLNLWRFSVDWNDPTGTTFGAAKDNAPDHVLSVAPYTMACNNTGATCIPQPHRTNGQEQLDSLGDRLMYRAAYRRFPDHDALVMNHSIDTGGDTPRTAIRWYEIRGLDKNTPTLAQQGTYSPNPDHRWIGSIAIDGRGRIALAYSATTPTDPVGIRMAARLPDDPPGTLRSETQLVHGIGVQTCTPTPNDCRCAGDNGACGRLTRWGDYSALAVDPVDDCTYWYSNQYLAEDGAFNWHTRIISFDLGPCALPQIRKLSHPAAPSKTD